MPYAPSPGGERAPMRLAARILRMIAGTLAGLSLTAVLYGLLNIPVVGCAAVYLAMRIAGVDTARPALSIAACAITAAGGLLLNGGSGVYALLQYPNYGNWLAITFDFMTALAFAGTGYVTIDSIVHPHKKRRSKDDEPKGKKAPAALVCAVAAPAAAAAEELIAKVRKAACFDASGQTLTDFRNEIACSAFCQLGSFLTRARNERFSFDVLDAAYRLLPDVPDGENALADLHYNLRRIAENTGNARSAGFDIPAYYRRYGAYCVGRVVKVSDAKALDALGKLYSDWTDAAVRRVAEAFERAQGAPK